MAMFPHLTLPRRGSGCGESSSGPLERPQPGRAAYPLESPCIALRIGVSHSPPKTTSRVRHV